MRLLDKQSIEVSMKSKETYHGCSKCAYRDYSYPHNTLEDRSCLHPNAIINTSAYFNVISGETTKVTKRRTCLDRNKKAYLFR